MNAVEIADAVADLAAQPFEASEFPFQFLAAFDKKETQLKRLRKGDINRSDVPNGVLLQSNIHIAVCAAGETHATLDLLKASPQTVKAKVKFVLATDGQTLEAEELSTGEAIASEFPKLADHIGFFLPLAGISTVREIKDNPIDVRATGRLNKLYVELLRQNPEWGTDARRHDMNHFMARLIFCFFAEDTDIFHSRGRFTRTIEQFSESDGSNTHQVIEACFRAMNTKIAERQASGVPAYADAFPYVNGGLFAGSTDVPKFTRIARSYLLQAGSLDWQHINPDIFGSMIQAVADEAERGALGMHYTSVPNILKVLNPLFLDELRAQLEAAGTNPRTLLNLRKRLSRIRVFDPACGSGNFLVIAYKELRKIEAEINQRRGEPMLPSEISKKNFRGIEIRDFAAEIARLALVIAEYQCDVLHRGPLAAKAEFLPLDEMNWITCGNALRLDWLKLCDPDNKQVRIREEGRLSFDTPSVKEIEFENEGGETYICGNPPYLGGKKQSRQQKSDMRDIFGEEQHKNLDYICGFIVKTCEFLRYGTKAALVTTNSVAQGTHVPVLWPRVYKLDCQIEFAYESFKWANNAQRNAGVICTIIGLTAAKGRIKYIYDGASRRQVSNINQYLVDGPNIIVESRSKGGTSLSSMITGNAPYDGGHLFLTPLEARSLVSRLPEIRSKLRRVSGTSEFINGIIRYCLWFDDDDLSYARGLPEVSDRIDAVLKYRKTGGEVASTLISRPHQFRYRNTCKRSQIIVPQTCSERRQYLPADLFGDNVVITHAAHAIYDPTLVDFAVLVSKLHLVWAGTISGRLKTDIRYSSNLGWNTFPMPELTEQDKSDLTRCAEDILLAREAHFPATIADLYDPEAMPENLRAAHDRNDETLERIYIGRRFKNDTERLETLFAMYAKMTAETKPTAKRRAATRRKTI